MNWETIVNRGKTFLAVLWLLFTVSFVCWWWIFGLQQINEIHLQHSSIFQKNETTEYHKKYRMLIWEGGALVLTVMVGGTALVILSYRDQRRHERLKIFFSTFAHDIKTSISRLILQAELLSQDHVLIQHPLWPKILKDIQRLDLLLENSLWAASLRDNKIVIRKMWLSEIVNSLRNEFEDVCFELNHDAQLELDDRVMSVVLRNMVHNSIFHGDARKISISVKSHSRKQLKIEIADDGKGFTGVAENLGRDVLMVNQQGSSGLGLYLCRRLLERMGGKLSFCAQPSFINVIYIKGESL